MFAIRSALKVCGALSIADYVVYNDCQGAVAQFTSDRVEWRRRKEMYLPNSYFDKVLGRASYLRATTNKVTKRKPAEPHQVEIFKLFQSLRCEFKLSESPLWARVSRGAARHERVLGLSGKERTPGSYMSSQGEEEFDFVPAYSWFGKYSPNRFLCRGEPVPTPVGALCMDCNEPFDEDSLGMIFSASEGAEESTSTHYECFMRTIPVGDPVP